MGETEHPAADAEPERERTEALAALLSAEDTGIQNAGQTSMALIGIIAAYLPVSLFAVYQGYGREVLAYLPLPVVLLMFFQMVQMAAMARRARSAAIVEAELVEIAGLHSPYTRGLLGTPARAPIVNPYAIITQRGDRWISRYVAAGLPFFGLYAIGVAYTWFLSSEAARLNPDYPNRTWTVVLPILLSLVLWSIFADSAMSYFTPRYRINIWVPMAGLAGIWLQAHQPTDPTPAWLYFSVYSAALITITALTRPFRWPGSTVLARAGVAGIIVSSLGFWLLVFPRDGFGHDEAQVWANLSMHLVAPIVTLLAIWYRRTPMTPLSWRQTGLTLAFPLGYGLFLLIARALWGTPIPYAFLNPDRSSVASTVATVVLTLVVFCLVGSAERIALAFGGRSRSMAG